MPVIRNQQTSSFWFLACKWLLAACILSGMLLGMFVASARRASYISMMRGLQFDSVSIVSLLAVWLLPFLITVLSVFFFNSKLHFPVSFLRAFTYGFCLQLFSVTYGSAAWLMRLLCMFTGTLTMILLCWFWLRSIPGKSRRTNLDAAICFAGSAAVSILDYCLVSPYLALLIYH